MTVRGLESAIRFGTQSGVIRGLENYVAEGGGALTFSDDFNRVNGSLGPNWVYANPSGWPTVSIVSNKAVFGGGHLGALTAAECVTGNQYVEADCTQITSGTIHLMVCGTENDTIEISGYALNWYQWDDRPQLTKAESTVHNFTNLLPGSGTVKLRLEKVGNVFEAFVNGVSAGTWTDTGTLLTGTRVGMCGGGSGETFDNFEGGDFTAGGTVEVVNWMFYGNRLDQYGGHGVFTLDFPVTAGNRLVAAFGAFNDVGITAAISPTDSLSQVWTRRGLGPETGYGSLGTALWDTVIVADDPSLDIDVYAPLVFDLNLQCESLILELTPSSYQVGSFSGSQDGVFLSAFDLGTSVDAAIDGSLGIAAVTVLAPTSTMTSPPGAVNIPETATHTSESWAQVALDTGDNFSSAGTIVGGSGTYSGQIFIYGPA